MPFLLNQHSSAPRARERSLGSRANRGMLKCRTKMEHRKSAKALRDLLPNLILLPAVAALIQLNPNPATIPLGAQPCSFSSSIMRKPPRHFRVARGTCSHVQRVLLAGGSHLLRHLLCWIFHANRFRGNTRKSRAKMPIGVQQGRAEKSNHLLKQVEQVKQGAAATRAARMATAAAQRDSTAAPPR